MENKLTNNGVWNENSALEMFGKRMKKQEVQMINELGDFIHAAFCVNGETEFKKIIPPSPGFDCEGCLFEITDRNRGLFYVTISKPI